MSSMTRDHFGPWETPCIETNVRVSLNKYGKWNVVGDLILVRQTIQGRIFRTCDSEAKATEILEKWRQEAGQ